MTQNKNILIVAETHDGALTASVRELVTLARTLAAQSTGRVACVLLGDASVALAQSLIACGVDCLYRALDTQLGAQPVEARLAPIELAISREAPHVVLLPHGVIGAELAPRLAFRLDGAVATGCEDVRVDAGTVSCTRPCYGGLAREVDAFLAAPVIVSVRPGIFDLAEPTADRRGEFVELPLPASALTRTRLIERKLDAAEGVRLEDARVVVAGGRGLEGADGFDVLAELANELDGALGASRVACDLGWCPHSWQVGLTGKTVTPELYIAVGISGAGHHMAGCGNAKTIVAINTDPDAAIFQDARFGVVGDYRAVVPALVAEIRRLKQAS